MALTRLSTSEKGQFPKCCEFCETDIKINWKCLNCDLLICTKCKEKIHSKIKSADKHKIIDIRNVGEHSDELDYSNINCENHVGQTCFMFCKSCDQLVCPQCIAEVHNGHGLVQISEGYKIKIENVKTIQQQIKSNIDELKNRELKIKLLRKHENSKYRETMNLIQTQNAALKMEVEKYTEKLTNELDQKWETLKESLDRVEHNVTARKINQEDLNAKADDIINSRDADQVFKENKKMLKFMTEAVQPVKMDFTTMPNFITGAITEYNFGSLQDLIKDLVLNIHQQFTTVIDVFHLSTCPDDSIWISDEKVLQRVKPEGINLEVMSTFNMKICGMALNPSNDLLLTTLQSRLKQISYRSGQVTDSVYSVDPLIPKAVHVTKDYKVIVGAGDSDRVVVIRMNKEGEHEKTYENDRNKQPIFTNVDHITTTTDGTIFVVDEVSLEDGNGRVVVLGQDDDVINTYTGHLKINSDDKPFKPLCVMTTPLDNIIVIDLYTDTLHILNTVGDLITYYKTNNIGIQDPYSLSFTSSGHLFIGCSKEDSTGKAKLYNVDISQL